MQVLEDDLLDPNEVSKKLTELEDRSPRNNLRFDGLMEDPNETQDDCERKVQDVILNKLNIEGNIEIDRCHRFGKLEDLAHARLFADFSVSKTNKKFFRILKN